MVHKCAYSEFHFPSMKMPDFLDGNGQMNTLSIKSGVFLDGNGQMSTLSIKSGVFMDGSRGYLLYLYDLTENIN